MQLKLTPRQSYWTVVIAFAPLYVAGAFLGLKLASFHGSVSPIWPASGLALALLLVFGRQYWPGIFLGGILASIAFTPDTGPHALLAGIGNALEAWVGAFLFERFTGKRQPFDRASDFIHFFGSTVVVASAIGASVGVSSLILFGPAASTQFTKLWVTWWVGDAIGILVVTPLVLCLVDIRNRFPKRKLEFVAMLLSVVLIAEVLFEGWFDIPFSSTVRPTFIIFPIVMWVAMRAGAFGVSVIMALTNIIAVVGAAHHNDTIGATFNLSDTEIVLLLQFLLAVAVLVGHVLAASISEKQRANECLQAELNQRDRAKQVLEKVELALTRKTEELSRSNSELENFASVASHDLKEPLRIISNYLQLLRAKYDQQLDSDARVYIHYSVDGAKRMACLIDDLLEYSRVGKNILRMEEIDSSTIVCRAIANSKASIDESKVAIELGELPLISANSTQLEVVFRNLIANAVKFRRADSPLIRITSEVTPERVLFKVEDNGIGIEKVHQEKIFQIFRRLHSSQDYPGTGIGLATCKKIIERHGGKIWVESAAGRGSVFCFTVPNAPASVQWAG